MADFEQFRRRDHFDVTEKATICKECGKVFGNKTGGTVLKHHAAKHRGESFEPRGTDRIWKYWQEKEKGSVETLDTMKCNHCDFECKRNGVEARKHMTTCENIDEDLRQQVIEGDLKSFSQSHKPVRASEASVARRESARTRRLTRYADDGSSESADEAPRHRRPTRQSQRNDAINLFSDFLENLGLDARKIKQKKPYSEYTEDDWRAEERELAIKERRARIRHLDNQADFFARLGPVLDRLIGLGEMFMAQKLSDQYPSATDCPSTKSVKSTQPEEALSTPIEVFYEDHKDMD